MFVMIVIQSTNTFHCCFVCVSLLLLSLSPSSSFAIRNICSVNYLTSFVIISYLFILLCNMNCLQEQKRLLFYTSIVKYTCKYMHMRHWFGNRCRFWQSNYPRLFVWRIFQITISLALDFFASSSSLVRTQSRSEPPMTRTSTIQSSNAIKALSAKTIKRKLCRICYVVAF